MRDVCKRTSEVVRSAGTRADVGERQNIPDASPNGRMPNAGRNTYHVRTVGEGEGRTAPLALSMAPRAIEPTPASTPPMLHHSRSLLSLVALSGVLSACADVTSPTHTLAALPQFSGSATDPSLGGSSGGGGGGGGTGGGTGGGGSTAVVCGVLSATVQTYNIVVYTTRIGIGFSGTATNCGSRAEAFQVDVVDTNPDAVCNVSVPHFIAARNTSAGTMQPWSANSTLVNCLHTTHNFVLTLRDTRTGQVLATTTASAFL